MKAVPTLYDLFFLHNTHKDTTVYLNNIVPHWCSLYGQKKKVTRKNKR